MPGALGHHLRAIGTHNREIMGGLNTSRSDIRNEYYRDKDALVSIQDSIMPCPDNCPDWDENHKVTRQHSHAFSVGERSAADMNSPVYQKSTPQATVMYLPGQDEEDSRTGSEGNEKPSTPSKIPWILVIGAAVIAFVLLKD
jgi:hypothetical protein